MAGSEIACVASGRTVADCEGVAIGVRVRAAYRIVTAIHAPTAMRNLMSRSRPPVGGGGAGGREGGRKAARDGNRRDEYCRAPRRGGRGPGVPGDRVRRAGRSTSAGGGRRSRRASRRAGEASEG